METQWQQPKVNFSIEIRPLTSVQKEAGKRLFSSLIARTQHTANGMGRRRRAEPPPAVDIKG
jgi:hypothetical protein